MTAVEARACLGLSQSGPLEKAAVRRAYLQAIKKHKPEADPDGFRSVREAYELLDQLVALGMEASPPPPASTTSPDASSPAGVPPPAGGPREPEPAAAAHTSHLEPFRARLVQMFGASWQQRAEVGWAAYDSFPGDVRRLSSRSVQVQLELVAGVGQVVVADR
jgi:hypothetical protein